MERITAQLSAWLWNGLMVAAALVIALAAAWLVMKIICSAGGTSGKLRQILARRLRGPVRLVLIALALSAVQPALVLGDRGTYLWQRIAGLLIPALLGWLAIAMLGIVVDVLQERADITVENNLQARRRRTRLGILYRVGMFVILLIAFCLALMSIPSVRNIGVTLIASAGLAGLAVGAAAQPALKNLVAGIQMAFTEPIRIDDVVIIDNEWGRIEDIRLTFVVVKIWDERRLIVPVSRFLEDSFQNWTRETSQLLGSVFWYLDPAADIPRIRARLEEVVKANPLWDGRFFNLRVTDTSADAIEVRALVTAKDASTAFDLRCDVREAILAFLREEMPEALPRRREEVRLIEPCGDPPAPG